MHYYRKIAITVGVLFIIATACGVSSGITLMPVLDAPDYVAQAAENESRMILGAAFYFMMAVAVAAIPIVIYPVLKKHSRILALGYIGARAIESVLFLMGVTTMLMLLTLSQEFIEVGSPDAAYFQTTGNLIKAFGAWTGDVLAGVIFPIGALMIYYVLFRTKLVPRWLAVWGLIGAILFPAGALVLFGPTISNFFYAPLALQEMVFAVWLIIKGFNPSVIAATES